MQLSEIQALFWDFDGVIADSVDVKTRAFEEMFAPFGSAIQQQAVAHHKKLGGISRVEKIEHSFRHFVGQPLSELALAEKCAEYSDRVKQKVVEAPLIEGALETLQLLHHQIPMFVISGTPQDELVEIAEQRKLSRYFRRILGSPVKKSEHVTNLLQEFHLDPGACVFIGDAMTDYNAAQATGTHFIGIHGFNRFPASTTVLQDCTGIIPALQAL